jgi:hypothetical protein
LVTGRTSGDVTCDTRFGCGRRAEPRGKVDDPLENDAMSARLAAE